MPRLLLLVRGLGGWIGTEKNQEKPSPATTQSIWNGAQESAYVKGSVMIIMISQVWEPQTLVKNQKSGKNKKVCIQLIGPQEN